MNNVKISKEVKNSLDVETIAVVKEFASDYGYKTVDDEFISDKFVGKFDSWQDAVIDMIDNESLFSEVDTSDLSINVLDYLDYKKLWFRLLTYEFSMYRYDYVTKQVELIGGYDYSAPIGKGTRGFYKADSIIYLFRTN